MSIDDLCNGTYMERVAGIEPASLAWKAKVLPLYHTRNDSILNRNKSVLGAMMSYDTFCKTIKYGGGRRIRTFEAFATDLQSVGFDRSPIPP